MVHSTVKRTLEFVSPWTPSKVCSVEVEVGIQSLVTITETS